eukprot:CAMPEP_0113958502 /NCGR_PEP_ID=MMETSP0011_2-20120614/3474_1 /TAXON_ID=101924 /ORGANISM="Rhodosorus marinus" /LENGTH=321 /DNA_ID=CAMNT_0000969409 /DNA_START=94 /DNA_END=1059 /DNA_ORIENTATION=- /assembly_acc=CAM_ASM_000156
MDAVGVWITPPSKTTEEELDELTGNIRDYCGEIDLKILGKREELMATPEVGTALTPEMKTTLMSKVDELEQRRVLIKVPHRLVHGFLDLIVVNLVRVIYMILSFLNWIGSCFGACSRSSDPTDVFDLDALDNFYTELLTWGTAAVTVAYAIVLILSLLSGTPQRSLIIVLTFAAIMGVFVLLLYMYVRGKALETSFIKYAKTLVIMQISIFELRKAQLISTPLPDGQNRVINGYINSAELCMRFAVSQIKHYAFLAPLDRVLLVGGRHSSDLSSLAKYDARLAKAVQALEFLRERFMDTQILATIITASRRKHGEEEHTTN